MREIASATSLIDIRRYELSSAEEIARELRPAVLARLREACALLRSLMDGCERSTPEEPVDAERALRNSYLPFERALDASVASRGRLPEAIDEVAFIAELELRQRIERLERVRVAQGAMLLLGECDSSLRRIRKALTAVDAVVARVSGTPPMLDFTSELQTSLTLRRELAKFSAKLTAGPPPTAATVRARLRSAGTLVAMLIGWEIYPDLRVRDRLVLREFQQRVLAWLRAGGEGDTEAAGLRLWQDLMAYVDMFSLVNRRQELVEHDAKVIRAVVRALEQPSSDPRIEPGVWVQLAALEGLDPELDQLLAGPILDRASATALMARFMNQFGLSELPPALDDGAL